MSFTRRLSSSAPAKTSSAPAKTSSAPTRNSYAPSSATVKARMKSSFKSSRARNELLFAIFLLSFASSSSDMLIGSSSCSKRHWCVFVQVSSQCNCATFVPSKVNRIKKVVSPDRANPPAFSKKRRNVFLMISWRSWCARRYLTSNLTTIECGTWNAFRLKYLGRDLYSIWVFVKPELGTPEKNGHSMAISVRTRYRYLGYLLQ